MIACLPIILKLVPGLPTFVELSTSLVFLLHQASGGGSQVDAEETLYKFEHTRLNLWPVRLQGEAPISRPLTWEKASALTTERRLTGSSRKSSGCKALW